MSCTVSCAFSSCVQLVEHSVYTGSELFDCHFQIAHHLQWIILGNVLNVLVRCRPRMWDCYCSLWSNMTYSKQYMSELWHFQWNLWALADSHLLELAEPLHHVWGAPTCSEFTLSPREECIQSRTVVARLTLDTHVQLSFGASPFLLCSFILIILGTAQTGLKLTWQFQMLFGLLLWVP